MINAYTRHLLTQPRRGVTLTVAYEICCLRLAMYERKVSGDTRETTTRTTPRKWRGGEQDRNLATAFKFEQIANLSFAHSYPSTFCPIYKKFFIQQTHLGSKYRRKSERGKKQSRIQPIEAKETREEPENDHLSFRLRLNISRVWILTSGLGSYMQQRTRSQTNKHPPNHSHPFLHLPNCDSAVPPLPLHHTPSDPPCRFNWCVNFCAD